MNSRKIYWFKIPKKPQIECIAVQPFIDPKDKRLVFYVPNEYTWRLPGKLIKDTEEQIVFETDGSLDGHGGRYELNLLTIKEFRKELKKTVPGGNTVAQVCKTTDDLHFWFRQNWSYPDYWEYVNWQMEENARKGIRTDT